VFDTYFLPYILRESASSSSCTPATSPPVPEEEDEYDMLLRLARTEDFRDLVTLNFLYPSGLSPPFLFFSLSSPSSFFSLFIYSLLLIIAT
jgi:hypothetical protein